MVIKKTNKRQAKEFVKDFVLYLRQEKKISVKQAYLFGSYAKNKQKDWSDIDVAVVSSKFKGKVDPYEFLWLSLRDIDVKRGLEPVGFSLADFKNGDPLVKEIKKNGIRIV